MEKLRVFLNKWAIVLLFLVAVVWFTVATFMLAFSLGKASDDWNDIAHQVVTEVTTEYLLENWGN